jgi:segregation and condensation protein B
VTAPDVDPAVQKFLKITSRQRLSRAAFEVLAIVAYHQPITIPEINQIRGANSSNSVNTLLEKRLLKMVGRKPVVGRPFLFGTTKEFLLHFGLNALEDLPKMEEMDAFKAE